MRVSSFALILVVSKAAGSTIGWQVFKASLKFTDKAGAYLCGVLSSGQILKPFQGQTL
jgi:hypothetical protein